ncbi:hypothetical protein KIN20_009035 [Parelaphostrongylus tenuis]|uniref:Uncharacterized protein n=1 Tax=Parelaphostrongylus tenuis TaxID=148309 RepID=A0AAD5M7M2_PARTN|nr:hypothetical protein KIN20_009035 [Parelaphostrongylus tenuis]
MDVCLCSSAQHRRSKNKQGEYKFGQYGAFKNFVGPLGAAVDRMRHNAGCSGGGCDRSVDRTQRQFYETSKAQIRESRPMNRKAWDKACSEEQYTVTNLNYFAKDTWTQPLIDDFDRRYLIYFALSIHEIQYTQRKWTKKE